ncbi:MAG: DUF1493 family protein [Alphaproteobacteria bacterium]|jgi:hypothetical protein|nr:DUF1493 family protein [Alphaproteobacteria bacterium]QQS56963.1 MAG: DUF1493 family protein [Alphaproteobacteria bacterium]
MIKEIVFEDFLLVIEENADFIPAKIDDRTRLCEDLRTYGDSAEELLAMIQEKYGTDFSNFKFSDYFPSEASADLFYYELTNFPPSNVILKTICNITFKPLWCILSRKREFKTITVGDLYSAVERGKWV